MVSKSVQQAKTLWGNGQWTEVVNMGQMCVFGGRGKKENLFMAEEWVFTEQATLKPWSEMSGFPPNPTKKELPHFGQPHWYHDEWVGRVSRLKELCHHRACGDVTEFC